MKVFSTLGISVPMDGEDAKAPKKQPAKAAKPTRAVAKTKAKAHTHAVTQAKATPTAKTSIVDAIADDPSPSSPAPKPVAYPPFVSMDAGQVLAVIVKASGNFAHAAKLMGTTRKALMERIISDAAIEDGCGDIEEGKVDAVETALYVNAVKGNVRAQELFLTRHPIAARRGWGGGEAPPAGSPSQHLHMHLGGGTEASEDVSTAIAAASIETLKDIQHKLNHFVADKMNDPIVLEIAANVPTAPKK